MNEKIDLNITCPCIHGKLFMHTLKVARRQKPAPIVVQIDCPFGHEEGCMKRISIELPSGIQPDAGEYILRGS